MKVGIIADRLHRIYTGIGTYAYNLIKWLSNITNEYIKVVPGK